MHETVKERIETPVEAVVPGVTLSSPTCATTRTPLDEPLGDPGPGLTPGRCHQGDRGRQSCSVHRAATTSPRSPKATHGRTGVEAVDPALQNASPLEMTRAPTRPPRRVIVRSSRSSTRVFEATPPGVLRPMDGVDVRLSQTSRPVASCFIGKTGALPLNSKIPLRLRLRGQRCGRAARPPGDLSHGTVAAIAAANAADLQGTAPTRRSSSRRSPPTRGWVDPRQHGSWRPRRRGRHRDSINLSPRRGRGHGN